MFRKTQNNGISEMCVFVIVHRELLPAQRSIAMISEMIHTASLVHDDVIDGSDTRRGKSTISDVWGEKKVRLPANTSPQEIPKWSVLSNQCADFVKTCQKHTRLKMLIS